MLGGGPALIPLVDPGAAGLVTKGGLVAVGPGPADESDEPVDLDTAEPRDLVADAPAAPSGSSLLASARELLDAAESWRGRPVVRA
jgi:hypothetical protein